MRCSRAAFILFHLHKELLSCFLITDLQEADQGRMQQQLWAMHYGLWTRTGRRGADEAKSQHEESEGLEEDVQVAVPGSEHDIV